MAKVTSIRLGDEIEIADPDFKSEVVVTVGLFSPRGDAFNGVVTDGLGVGRHIRCSINRGIGFYHVTMDNGRPIWAAGLAS